MVRCKSPPTWGEGAGLISVFIKVAVSEFAMVKLNAKQAAESWSKAGVNEMPFCYGPNVNVQIIYVAALECHQLALHSTFLLLSAPQDHLPVQALKAGQCFQRNEPFQTFPRLGLVYKGCNKEASTKQLRCNAFNCVITL